MEGGRSGRKAGVGKVGQGKVGQRNARGKVQESSTRRSESMLESGGKRMLRLWLEALGARVLRGLGGRGGRSGGGLACVSFESRAERTFAPPSLCT